MEALATGPSTADWGDVRTRTVELRRHRKRVVVALAAAVTILVVGSAFALATDVIHFGSAAPAPEPWRKIFSELERAGGGPGSTETAAFRDARVVVSREIGGQRLKLCVAPRQGGGLFLYLLEELDPARGGGGGAAAWAEAGDPLTRFGELLESNRPRGVYGTSAARGAREIEVILADGTTARTDVTWVSEPIDAGVYLLEVPAGEAIESFVVRDAKGRELARRGLPGPSG